jgi:hypothetical protein
VIFIVDRSLLTSQIPAIDSPVVQPSSSFSINSPSRATPPAGPQHRETSPLCKTTQYQAIIDRDDQQTDLSSSNVIIEEAEGLMGAALAPRQDGSEYHEVSPNRSLSDMDGDSGSRANTRSSYGALSENRDLEHLYDNSYNSEFDSDRTNRGSEADSSESTSLSSSLVGSSQQEVQHLSLNFLYHG